MVFREYGTKVLSLRQVSSNRCLFIMIRFVIILLLASLLPVKGFVQNRNTVFRSKMVFPGQTLANLWGYAAPDGREYALLGASQGLIIVDVTQPDAPLQIVQIPGPNNLWKEVKTYGHYCYVVSEGGQGIQVINLQGLPSPNVASKFYTGDGVIQGQLNRIHALHIDLAKGYLYAYGGNLFNGGAKIFDIYTDPWNPRYVGKFDQLGYIHDGYVDDDILYSSHIYSGQFAVVDMSNKFAPALLSTQETPGKFTHNTWLTDDRTVLLTTDEVNNSVLAAYDVSDPDNIRFLDRIQSNSGSNSVVHNTHILGDYAITSWYRDGFTIVDITRPDNLVQVGDYDTYPGIGGGGFDGCWGVYPYFPSGTLVATNISAPGMSNHGELYIISPEYVRACYLEGVVRDAETGFPIPQANIEIVGAPLLNQQQTNAQGMYKMGQVDPGYFTARIVRGGYQSRDVPVVLYNGQVTILDVELFPDRQLSVGGRILSGSKHQPYQSAWVHLYGDGVQYTAMADADGWFNIANVKPGQFAITGQSHTGAMTILHGQRIVSDTTLMLYLFPDHRRHSLKNSVSRASEDLLSGAFSVYPNPSGGAFSVSYHLDNRERMRLVDQLGRVVWEVQVESGEGHVRADLDVAPGVYYLHLGGRVAQVLLTD